MYHVMLCYNADVPSGVMNVTIRDDITNESFVGLWDEVMDIFTITYNVTWYNESGIIGMDTVNSPPYTVTGLTTNTHYSVTVVAINTCCGTGPVSVPVEVMTMREPASGNVIVCMYVVVRIQSVTFQSLNHQAWAHTHMCTHVCIFTSLQIQLYSECTL